MMKAILLSIKPEWAEKIYNGEKTIEWRKSRPRIDRNNCHTRVYIYETAPVKRITGYFTLAGCYEVDLGCKPVNMADALMTVDIQRRGCVPREDLVNYQGKSRCIYAWSVDQRREMVRYNVPYRLDNFGLKRPPQSWQYVEDII
jgi:predicted transcriptional regulator